MEAVQAPVRSEASAAVLRAFGRHMLMLKVGSHDSLALAPDHAQMGCVCEGEDRMYVCVL